MALTPPSSTSSGTSSGSTDGWVDDSAQTWTRTGASTFTVPTDLTATFTPGTRLRLTQSAAVAYFVVVSSAFAAGVTTVTVTGGSDYTLAAAAISAQAHSYAANPQGYPGWFNFAPATVGDSGDGSSGRFAVVGRTCTCSVVLQGTSTAATKTFTLPIAVAAGFPVLQTWAKVEDNAVVHTAPGMITLTAGSAAGAAFTDMASAGWVSAGAFYAISTFEYGI